ncbi:NAD-dependent epimerase/dehydratase family protein [Parapedobacter sp.]
MKVQVLLSGASGFLGAILKENLTSGSFAVTSLGRSASDLSIDIRHPFSFDLNPRFEIVVHAAAKAHSVPETEAEKEGFYQVNYEGTKNLCRALENLKALPRSFVFVSTVAVYGVDEGEGIDESRPPNPVTPYADSKALAEKWLTQWAKENDVTLSILRLPLIAGWNPPGNLGAMINGIKSGKYLSIGKADARKSVVWAEDIARIIPVLADKGGTYNLTDGVHPTFGELEAAIADSLNKRKPIKVPYWLAKSLATTGDVVGSRFPINSEKLKKITSTLTFDDQKARKELGWRPTAVLSKISEVI